MLCGALAKFLKVTLYPMGLVISGGFSWCPFLGPEGIPHPEGIKITHPPHTHTHILHPPVPTTGIWSGNAVYFPLTTEVSLAFCEPHCLHLCGGI